jgi:hypothetical protein
MRIYSTLIRKSPSKLYTVEKYFFNESKPRFNGSPNEECRWEYERKE